jgi:hypothetical protein
MSYKNIATLSISLFAIFSLSSKQIQATESAVLDNRIEHANVQPMQFRHMSEIRFGSMLYSDQPISFKSEGWKARPDDRLRMLKSMVNLLPGQSRDKLLFLLGPDKIVGGDWGDTAKADRFLLNSSRCGATTMSVLEVDYQEDKAYRYRLLYFPEGVSTSIVEASDWCPLAK